MGSEKVDLFQLNDIEISLVLAALDKKIWSLHHVGLGNDHPRVKPFVELRKKLEEKSIEE